MAVFKVKHFVDKLLAGDQEANVSKTLFTDHVAVKEACGGLL